MSDQSSDSELSETPPVICDTATHVANSNLLPKKSRKLYEKTYKDFMEWKMSKETKSFSEEVLLAYFEEMSKKFKAPSLWTFYSMLKSTLIIRHEVDIAKFIKLTAFLKCRSEGHKKKKSKTFLPQEINKFIKEAPDKIYLFAKIGLIFGIMGSCRRQELYNLMFNDVQVFDSTLILVNVRNNKTKIARTFTITGNYCHLVKKYMELRPTQCTEPSFFLQYSAGKCTMQKIGINKFGSLGKEIADFLQLPNPQLYTGHCFRRTSATLLVDAGGDITTLKLKQRKSTKVAEGYIDESMQSKVQVSTKILNSIQNKELKIEMPHTPSNMEQDSATLEATQMHFAHCTKLNVNFNVHGPVPPVFTPMKDDQVTVDYDAIPPYAKFLTDNGIKAVLVGGTTGEHMTLSISDRKKVIDKWVALAPATGLHIMVQVGGAPMADVLELATYCQNNKVDSLLTLPELYFKPGSVDDLVSYVELVAKAAPKLPVLYYHIPHMSRVEINMPAFVAAATSRIPNFKGIKFTSNDLNEGAQVLRTLEDGQEMFLGADTLLAPAALLGGRSSIGTSYNLFPLMAKQILNAVSSKDLDKARQIQQKLSLAIEAHLPEGAWVPIMKAGMEIVTGLRVGPPALPQRPISAEARNRIQEKLRALGLCK